MNIDCTSSRRLTFEEGNETHDQHPRDTCDDVSQNELVSFNSMNDEDFVLRIGTDFNYEDDAYAYDRHSQHPTVLGDNLSHNNESGDFKNVNDGDYVPKIGMCFNSEDDAYEFYLKYSRRVGFGIRRSKSHNDKSGELVDRIFCCSAQGKRTDDKRDIYVKKARPQTRFGCEAKLKVSRRDTGGMFFVVQFVADHSHPLSSPNKVHLHRSHRKIVSPAALQIQMANDVGITPKASHDLLVKQAGGRENLGFIPQDYKNYLRSKRTRATRIGDTGGLLEYLQKMQFDDPNFFYAIQVDEDDLITNIFWCDAKMRTDYFHFGDVVCFDTTYKKNNEGRPIALFVGVNHHKQTVIFGAALLYDETALTFEWLFDTFTKAMSDKRPITILTDQDAAMAKALASTWPETHHRLCLWHIFQNAAVHLSSYFSKFKEFSKDFGACVYDFEEEGEFLEAWDKMLNKYGLEDNDWLRRMFNLREKWALVYGRQFFCADMTTTQRSESVNSVVKKYVNYKHKFLDFFGHFQRLLENRRYEETVAEFKANTSCPSLAYPVEILSQAAAIYTPAVYKTFEKEWYKSHDSMLECVDDGGTYKITPYKRKHHHIVTFDSLSERVSCSCRKFEFAGIICSHILKVFIMKNVKKIPSQYILKRWTRQAKVGFNENSNVNTCNLDPSNLQNARYRELCSLYLQLVTKASENEDDYRLVKDGILRSIEIVDGRLRNRKSNDKHEGVMPDQNSDQHVDQAGLSLNGSELQIDNGNGRGAKGIKYKSKTTSGKRLKSGLEKASGKKRARRTKKTQPPAVVTTPSQLLPSSSEVIQNEVETPYNTFMAPLTSYEGLGTNKEVQTSSSQQNLDGFSSSMSMTSLLLAQHPFPFGSLGSFKQ